MAHTFSTFESELLVRPDDIDMNNHVHFSRYLDYVLAARYDQMERCYHMSMKEFIARGLGWVVKSCAIEYKRPLMLGDTMIVRTRIDRVEGSEAGVWFQIVKKDSGKVSAEGRFDYTLINLRSGRAEKISKEVIDMYSI